MGNILRKIGRAAFEMRFALGGQWTVILITNVVAAEKSWFYWPAQIALTLTLLAVGFIISRQRA